MNAISVLGYIYDATRCTSHWQCASRFETGVRFYALMVLIELFSLGVMAEVLQANFGSKSGAGSHKISSRRVAPTDHSSQKK